MFAYIYVVTRDFGFAPNPFYGICTLATCKPGIRKSAVIGDWIFGIGSKTRYNNRLIYMMKVSKKISFNEYWLNPEYSMKKPSMHASLKRMYGDNIYYYNNSKKQWEQLDSHHSYENGKINYHNLNRDTNSDNVLISTEFFYFGINAIEIPKKFRQVIYKSRRGYCKELVSNSIQEFIDFVKNNYMPGYSGDPMLFTKFSRYDGLS